MDAASVLTGIAVISSFFSAFSLLPWLMGNVQRGLVSSRSQTSALPDAGMVKSLVRNGISWLNPLAKLLLKNPQVYHLFIDAQQVLASRSFASTPLNLCTLSCLLALLTAVVGSLIGGSLVIGLILAFGGILASIASLNHAQEARREAIREAVPDALRSMSICSHAGLSLQQSFNQVAQEIRGPLKFLFTRAAHDLDAGRTINEALAEFRENSHVAELAFVAVALDVQHRAGGSLQQVLDAARDSVESELELKRNLRVQTAQAKLSARIVCLMPFILIALFSVMSPGFLSPFFRSIEGFALLGLAAFMQMSGILIVRHLLKVEVD